VRPNACSSCNALVSSLSISIYIYLHTFLKTMGLLGRERLTSLPRTQTPSQNPSQAMGRMGRFIKGEDQPRTERDGITALSVEAFSGRSSFSASALAKLSAGMQMTRRLFLPPVLYVGRPSLVLV
jgi:hypothetical protein